MGRVLWMVSVGALKTPSLEQWWQKSCYAHTKSAQKLVKGIKYVDLAEKDVMIELDEVKNAPDSTKLHVLKIHMAKQVIKKSWFQCLQLYEIVSYKEPFRDQWYHRENGSEPCGHFILPNNFHPNKSCRKCFEVEIGCSWRQCPCYTQWYHKQCFCNWIWLNFLV